MHRIFHRSSSSPPCSMRMEMGNNLDPGGKMGIHRWLQIDPEKSVATMSTRLREAVFSELRRKGCVIPVCGVIDSSVRAALSLEAFGKDHVYALLLPEKDSSSASMSLGEQVCQHLDIRYSITDITPTLNAIGCYRWRDDAIRSVFPEYGEGWKNKIAIARNRLEYDQGFFVKNGDGSADVKPIAHLYKSQVYELGRFFGLPENTLSASPTTDTYSLEQSQDEFYFLLPFEQMDIAMFGLHQGKTAEEVAKETGLTPEQVNRVFRDIEAKRKTTLPLHRKPILLDRVPEIGT